MRGAGHGEEAGTKAGGWAEAGVGSVEQATQPGAPGTERSPGPLGYHSESIALEQAVLVPVQKRGC